MTFLVIASCGDDDDTSTAEATTTAAGETETTTAASEGGGGGDTTATTEGGTDKPAGAVSAGERTSEDAGEPVKGGTLVYGQEADTANPWAPRSTVPPTSTPPPIPVPSVITIASVRPRSAPYRSSA